MNWPAPLDMAFMRHAFAAGSCIAIAGSAVGYFVVLRRQAFAAHGLANIGFAGAAGASMVGLDPMAGLFVFVLAAAALMAVAGDDIGDRDISVGMILMFSLGLGILFVNLYSANANANAAIGILFGSVLDINTAQLQLTAGVSVVVVLLLAAMYRPLRFASLNPAAARARGLPVTLISTLFLLILALMSAVAVPVIGALLSFAIFVGPAAAAQAWTGRVATGVLLTVVLALAETWGGLCFSYYANVPAISCIAALSFLLYVVSRIPVRSLIGSSRGRLGTAG